MLKKKKFDVIIILILIIAAAMIYYFFTKNSIQTETAEIIINGKTEKVVSLNKDKVFSLEKIPQIKFEIKDKKIRFIDSNCPDKICINTGFIGIAGQTAVCLPNAVSIKIIPNEDNNDLDVIL